jgi:hypothetical protein
MKHACVLPPEGGSHEIHGDFFRLKAEATIHGDFFRLKAEATRFMGTSSG